jgi:hypothetical protein
VKEGYQTGILGEYLFAECSTWDRRRLRSLH